MNGREGNPQKHHHHHHDNSYIGGVINQDSRPIDPIQSPIRPAGTLPDLYYRSQLSPWVFSVRSFLLRRLDSEIDLLRSIQDNLRSDLLDRLMIHCSWLGSHSFFTVALSISFWFGHQELARTMVLSLAGSVYLTGCIKDTFCIPRPFSPPIDRLAISNHASEYGFPSTHSATSTNTILIAAQLILDWYDSRAFEDHPKTLYNIAFGLGFSLYAFFLIFGRIYCGMHSVQDVLCGSFIGTFVWLVNYCLGPSLKLWFESSNTIDSPETNRIWSNLPVPFVIAVVGLALTAAHPQPVDDCPCFEDSTAFVAVSVGVMIGQWTGVVRALPPIEHDGGPGGWIRSILKVVIGMMIIFGWRLTMKEVLSRVLPPLFRAFSPLVELPRRHYNPTTDYKTYRDELQEQRRRYGFRVALIPSLLHLPMSSSSSNDSPNNRKKKDQQLRNRFTRASGEDRSMITESLHPALRNRNNETASSVDPLSNMEEKVGSTLSLASFSEEEEGEGEGERVENDLDDDTISKNEDEHRNFVTKIEKEDDVRKEDYRKKNSSRNCSISTSRSSFVSENFNDNDNDRTEESDDDVEGRMSSSSSSGGGGGSYPDFKRYDVDVLMRLIVYCGIGLLASTGLPLLFFKLGIL